MSLEDVLGQLDTGQFLSGVCRTRSLQCEMVGSSPCKPAPASAGPGPGAVEGVQTLAEIHVPPPVSKPVGITAGSPESGAAWPSSTSSSRCKWCSSTVIAKGEEDELQC